MYGENDISRNKVFKNKSYTLYTSELLEQSMFYKCKIFPWFTCKHEKSMQLGLI